MPKKPLPELPPLKAIRDNPDSRQRRLNTIRMTHKVAARPKPKPKPRKLPRKPIIAPSLRRPDPPPSIDMALKGVTGSTAYGETTVYNKEQMLQDAGPVAQKPLNDLLSPDEMDIVLAMKSKKSGVGALKPSEKVVIIKMHLEGYSQVAIGKTIGRSNMTVSNFLAKYRTTVPMARLHFEASAERLARRVVSKANVQESMEVLDRIDVLPKKVRDDGSAPKFNILIGAGGGGQVNVTAPSQAQIEAARSKPSE